VLAGGDCGGSLFLLEVGRGDDCVRLGSDEGLVAVEAEVGALEPALYFAAASSSGAAKASAAATKRAPVNSTKRSPIQLPREPQPINPSSTVELAW